MEIESPVTKKAGKQTQPVRWRGEIKIQQELETLTGRVKRRGKFLATNQDRTISVEWPTSKALRRLLNSRPKAYFKATLLGDGTLDIRQEVPTRNW